MATTPDLFGKHAISTDTLFASRATANVRQSEIRTSKPHTLLMWEEGGYNLQMTSIWRPMIASSTVLQGCFPAQKPSGGKTGKVVCELHFI